ncbi:hypothetical protein M2139_001392 [Enterococcus sp. PF1-24]|uniref:hypothetical protein n=1 Tax=unclassified Enterococcus TaxID=2608891 RepID=UPI002473602A|nr:MULTISPECIES: hypothetical protein [unclassified Enterococcus]MDH6364469.1 hypothetical protein [Enterococcus sp. PFB1-1]MDH6401508.1 hypothetical protein [Enterococcus sp. PF1-24]
MKHAVEEFIRFGTPPEEYTESNDIPQSWIYKYGELISMIEKPITYTEAMAIIRMYPKEYLFGLEMSLIHIIESCTEFNSEKQLAPNEVTKYLALINECNSDYSKELLLKRFNNSLNDKYK